MTAQIINTIAELENLDPDTVLTACRRDGHDVVFRAWDALQGDDTPHFPAVVVCEGQQVLAARRTLRGRGEDDRRTT